MNVNELTAQQRAALVTFQLCLRAVADLPGLSIDDIASMLGIQVQSARALLCNISECCVPIYDDKDGLWYMDDMRLKGG